MNFIFYLNLKNHKFYKLIFIEYYLKFQNFDHMINLFD